MMDVGLNTGYRRSEGIEIMAARAKFVDYDARRSPRTDIWCCMCQRDLPPNGSHRHVYLDGEMRAIHPQDLTFRPEETGDFGWKRMGTDCARRFGLEWTTEAPIPAPGDGQGATCRPGRG